MLPRPGTRRRPPPPGGVRRPRRLRAVGPVAVPGGDLWTGTCGRAGGPTTTATPRTASRRAADASARAGRRRRGTGSEQRCRRDPEPAVRVGLAALTRRRLHPAPPRAATLFLPRRRLRRARSAVLGRSPRCRGPLREACADPERRSGAPRGARGSAPAPARTPRRGRRRGDEVVVAIAARATSFHRIPAFLPFGIKASRVWSWHSRQ